MSHDFAAHSVSKNYVKGVVALIKERATFVADFWAIAPYLFTAPKKYVEKDAAKFWKEENYTLALKAAEHMYRYEGPWTAEAVGEELEGFIRGNEWPMGKVMNCLRLALSGASSGLGIADILSFIGKDEFRSRMENAVAQLG